MGKAGGFRTFLSSQNESAMTFVSRKVHGGIRCYREHGARYTLRRTLYHMGLWGNKKTITENNQWVNRHQMNQPIVSVIIPVYNTEKYLRACLDSVVNQTVKDIEIICVDDGSTDSSLAILQEYESKDSRVKVYAQEKSNAGAARNVGLSKATGEYLAFLDSDDYYELFMLEHMLTCAHKRAADIVVCRFHTYNERTGKTSNSCWGVKMDRLPSKKVFSYYEIDQECFSSIMGCPWNKLFKRKLVTENKLRFQEQPVFNDAFFSYSAMISTNALTVLDESLICYRLRALSDSITDRRSEYMDCSYLLLSILSNESNHVIYVEKH